MSAYAQFGASLPDEFETDDLSIGGDIFNDFNEDLESEQVLEDERFYTYGRFYSLHLGMGLTTFSGNRGTAYNDSPPTINFGFNFFQNFRVSYVLGIAYSKHSMFFDQNLNETGSSQFVGQVDVNMIRVYTGFRYYIDTADLGTALTYSNPYFTFRLEYWYVNNKYVDNPAIEDDAGGGIGTALGGGFEWPIELKESYINFEYLFHAVNYHDINTRAYQPSIADLQGYGFTYIVNYVIGW